MAADGQDRRHQQQQQQQLEQQLEQWSGDQ
jgi:hypothetical protein